MTFTHIERYPHKCTSPTWFMHESFYAPGSLWECNECGREWIKMESEGDDRWKPTIEVLVK